MRNKNVTHLTFDFFGTLVGYTPGHTRGNNSHIGSHKYLLDNGLQIDYDTYLKDFSDAYDTLLARSKVTNKEFHMRDVTQLFFSKHSKTLSQKTIDAFIEMDLSEWNKGITLYPEMKPFLQKLKKKYSISIISNTHHASLVHRNLEAMGIGDYFDLVLTSVEYGIPKPNPEIFKNALRQLSVLPQNTIHVGDSYNDDYQGATDVGIRSILLDPDHKWDGQINDRVNSIFDIEKLL